MFDHMKKTKVIAALTAGVGVACDAYGSANADTAKLAQLQRQLASVNASATFARIPAGTFQMGSPSSESGRYDNEVLHSVTISHGFEMEVTDVTQLQWFRVMGYNPAHFKAQQYCQSDYISMNGTDLCRTIRSNRCRGMMRRRSSRSSIKATTDTLIAFRQKRSGNTQLVPGREPPTTLVTMRHSSMRVRGIPTTPAARPTQWVERLRTLLASTTWLGTYGSGCRTITATTVTHG